MITLKKEIRKVLPMVLFVFALVTGFCLISVIRYRNITQIIKMPSALYWAGAVFMSAVMFFAVFKTGLIENRVLLTAVQFIGTAQFIIVLYSPLIFLLRDLLALFVKKWHTVLFAPKFYICSIAFLLLLTVIGFVNINIKREKDYTVEINKKAEVEEIDFAVISDLHIGTGILVSQLPEFVEFVNSLGCDAVLIVGDVVDNNTADDSYEAIAASLSSFDSKYGTFFSYGNHDGNGQGNIGEWLEKAGVRVLRDEAAELDGVTLIGRNDINRRNSKSMAELDFDSAKPVIVMNHQPRQLQEMADAGADLVLSGHTHGEQFPLCYFLNIISNDEIYGLHHYGNMTSIVTSGAGGWGFRFKFPSGSEVAKVKVRFTGN